MNKKKIIIGSLIVIPFLLVALYFQFHTSFKEVIHADRSVNPKATNYFAHAMLINMGEMLVHDFFFIDYDNFLFKPLHALQDNLFKEGQKYIASDNLAEEGVWWSLIHLNKYGLIRSGRKDRSLIEKELKSKNSLPMRDQALKYFYAVIDEGVKGVEFGGKEFSATYGLFIFPFYKISYTYSGETRSKQIDNYWEDHSLYQKSLISYQKYKSYFRNDPRVSEKSGAITSSMIGRLSYLIGFNMFNNHLEPACGQLLDDYLMTLTSQELDVDELGPNRIKTVDVILKDLATKCPMRQIEILNTKKQFFHILEDK